LGRLIVHQYKFHIRLLHLCGKQGNLKAKKGHQLNKGNQQQYQGHVQKRG
jgi:hypothetical protein